jgi:hypothetical protein
MKKCPYRFNLKKQECIEHDCEFFTHLVGMNPQTGTPQDEWGCSLKWLPILMIEASNMTRQVSAALDRNNNTLFSALPEPAQQRVIQSIPNLLTNGKKNV